MVLPKLGCHFLRIWNTEKYIARTALNRFFQRTADSAPRGHPDPLEA